MVRMPPNQPVRPTSVGSNATGVKVHCTLTLGPGTPKVHCTPAPAPGAPEVQCTPRVPIPLLGSNDNLTGPDRGLSKQGESLRSSQHDHVKV